MVVADACEQGRREGRARGWRGRAALGVGIATRVRACGAEHIGGYPQMVDLDNDLSSCRRARRLELRFRSRSSPPATRSRTKLHQTFRQFHRARLPRAVRVRHGRVGCARLGLRARAVTGAGIAPAPSRMGWAGVCGQCGLWGGGCRCDMRHACYTLLRVRACEHATHAPLPLQLFDVADGHEEETVKLVAKMRRQVAYSPQENAVLVILPLRADRVHGLHSV